MHHGHESSHHFHDDISASSTAKQLLDDSSLESHFDALAVQNYQDVFSPHELLCLDNMFHSWELKLGHQVLEPGCGQGRLTELIAHHVGPQGKVMACDLSGKMISRAINRLANQGLLDRTEFFHGSILDMTLPVCDIDKALLFNVFPDLIHKEAALSLCARTLVPGGALWINQLQIENHEHGHLDDIESLFPAKSMMKSLIKAAGLTFVDCTIERHFYSLHAIKPN